MAVRRACELRYLNEWCLAILNLHVAPMSPTYCSGGDVIGRILRPSWLQEYKKYALMPPANSFKSNSLGEDFIEEFQDDCYG